MYWCFDYQCPCRLVKGIILCIYRFSITKLSPLRNLSLGFILELFLKFRKFQPRYSYERYSYIKNRVYEN